MQYRVLPFLALLMTITLLGCGSSEETATVGRTEQPVTGGVYRRAFADSFVVLDPALIKDSNSHEVCRQIYDGLVEFDENADVVPAIAREWSISEDKKVYTFHLRTDVRFHKTAGGKNSLNGGRHLKADDVLYSFKRLLRQKEDSQASFFWVIKGGRDFSEGRASDISGIRVVSADTIEFFLEQPFAPFISLLAMCNAFIVPSEDAEGDLKNMPVGTGPFRWVGRASDTIILEANDGYFRGRPWLDRLEFPVIKDETERFNAFMVGNLSQVEVPDSQYKNVRQDRKLSACLLETSLWGTNYLGFNTRTPPFDNPWVRKALNYAVDRETIIKLVLNDCVRSAHGVLPPGIPGFNKDLAGYSYDLRKARECLEKAGYPDGNGFPEIVLQYNRDEIHSRIAEFVLANLRDIGIRCVIRELEFGEHLKSVEEGRASFFRMGWTVDYPDPDSFLYALFHSSNIDNGYNFSGLNLPALDALLEKARFETEMQNRVQLYQQAEKLIIEEAPWVFLYFYKLHILHQPQVRGIAIGPMGEALLQYRKIWFLPR